jgi:Mrp family chromosome partitioning ATPase
MTAADSTKRAGKIVTFYSYKGGTGRSMALANVAWVLASSGKRVLTIDWDLEAPGLHRYFEPFLADKSLEQSTGIIDFVRDFVTAAVAGGRAGPEWYEESSDVLAHAVSLK